jgi:predicted aldo/keto reductase-like oxidoreductase
MRLPTLDGKPYGKKIDREKATRMIRHSIDQGVNYIDTAYPYHEGMSEVLLGRVLKEGYRERVKIATKSPIWLIKKSKDFDTYLDQQLERLQTGHIEFYLFHGLNGQTWKEVVKRHDLLKRAKAAVKDGRIGDIGFSFHDDFAAFKQIIDGYDDWCLCQIQYNYMDTENQAGTKGLKYAASKGLPVVVMEPLLGGKLAIPPEPIRDILRKEGRGTSPADLALQWLWNQREVSVVLRGMSTIRQVNGNLKSADRSGVGSLSPDDFELIRRIKSRYLGMVPVPCTKCGYCMPCPNGVDIPKNFELYNDGIIHDDIKDARFSYNRFFEDKEKAGACKQCGKCEEKCPQKIQIQRLMPELHAVLGEGKRPGAIRRP